MYAQVNRLCKTVNLCTEDGNLVEVTENAGLRELNNVVSKLEAVVGTTYVGDALKALPSRVEKLTTAVLTVDATPPVNKEEEEYL